MGYQWPYAVAVLLFAAGLWLLLPSGTAPSRRRRGAALVASGLGLLTLLVHFGLRFVEPAPYVALTAELPLFANWPSDLIFLALALLTIGSAVCAMTLRSPVYCAIWFALMLLGSGGLFMYQGAQFVGIATVVVYAGAILVTFLFVLMLAQPAGQAYYDRVSWEGMLSACTGAVLVGVMTMSLGTALAKRDGQLAQPPTAESLQQGIMQGEHVARVGGELFGRHLIAVEVAGVLLLVALVGAVVMIGFGMPRRAAGEASRG